MTRGTSKAMKTLRKVNLFWFCEAMLIRVSTQTHTAVDLAAPADPIRS